MSFAAKLYVSTDPRRSDRRTADIDGTLRGQNGMPIDVRVIDISCHGFRCLTTSDLREGDAVRIGLRGNGDGSAVIRWRRGAQIGCEFVLPLTEAQALNATSTNEVVAVAHWAGTKSARFVPGEAMEPAGRPARIFARLLAAALLIDLLNGYVDRLW